MKPSLRLAALPVILGPALLPAGAALAAQPAPASLVIHGRGDGHGVGLPQDGALALGRAGKSAAQILATFYPGTTLQAARSARMHVQVWQDQASTGATQISLPAGGKIYGLVGHVAVPVGGLVDLTFSGNQWTARLATASLGTGGRSVPRSIADDDPTPDPPAGTPTPDDPPTSGGPTASADPPASADPTLTAPPATSPTSEPAPEPSATATDAPGGAAESSAPVTSSSAGTATGAPADVPSSTASAGVGGVKHDPAAADPSPVPTTGAIAAIPESSVSGPDLDVVPHGADGLTTLIATGRSYRGQVLTAPGQLVNDVPLELYLRGLGEVLGPSWPQAGLQALIIAARTYALRDALGADDPGDHQHVNICATDACQVYLGAGVEYPQLTRAVEATQGEVLEWQGALAETYYSASAGGETATPSEGFGDGSTDVPYLTPVSYDDGGKDGWQRSIDFAAAATALHYPGTLTQIEVTARGPSGRATAVVLHGSGGDVATTGVAVEAALGLPSTLFTTGFGIDAPQVSAATSSSVLPALTAASLGQVAVPLPVLAADAATVPVVAAPPVVRLPVIPQHIEVQAAASAEPRQTPVGVYVWFAILGWLVGTALVVSALRPVVDVVSWRRSGSHRAATNPS